MRPYLVPVSFASGISIFFWHCYVKNIFNKSTSVRKFPLFLCLWWFELWSILPPPFKSDILGYILTWASLQTGDRQTGDWQTDKRQTDRQADNRQIGDNRQTGRRQAENRQTDYRQTRDRQITDRQ